jgi:spermidine/putrescine transport system substrate-binding protein
MAARSIRLLCWADYLAPAVLSRFEVETGIRVEGVWFTGEDAAAARVLAGEPFDVVVASDYVAERYRKAGVLQPLDVDRLPGLKGVTDTRLRKPPCDPETDGHKYTSVLYFGTEGIAVRTDQVTHVGLSWEVLFDPLFAGRIAMLDEAREVLSTALYLLGESPNSTDHDVLERATAMLIEQRPLVVKYDSDTPWRSIVDGVTVVHCFGGDVTRAINEGVTQVRYIRPREGFTIWIDGPCIPVSAADPDAAHRFIEFLLDPEAAAANADHSGYHPVVSAADPLTKSLVQRSMRPTTEQIETGTFLADVGDFNAVYESSYRRIRGISASS